MYCRPIFAIFGNLADLNVDNDFFCKWWIAYSFGLWIMGCIDLECSFEEYKFIMDFRFLYWVGIILRNCGHMNV